MCYPFYFTVRHGHLSIYWKRGGRGGKGNECVQSNKIFAEIFKPNMLLRTFQAIHYGFIFFNVHIHPAIFALLFFGHEREREWVCVWCAAKYFLCHLSLNKCIYGTHPTFYRLLYRCYELIITNIKRNGEWNWWHIPNLCGTDIEWQKRHICVHETYGWTEKKSSLMTYAPPVPMIRSLSFGLPVRLHDNQKFRFLRADKRFLFFFFCVSVSEKMCACCCPHLEPVQANGHEIWYGQLIQLL